MVFSETFLKAISTSEIRIPSTPQILLDNPLDDETFVNGIELILTPEFAKKGKLKITMNGVTIFSPDKSVEFINYAKFPIPLGKLFRRSESIEVFAWNGTDTNTIKMDMNISISKDLQPFNSQAVPLDKNLINELVSEGQSLFPKILRFNTDENILLDLEGFKKFWVILDALNYVSGLTVDLGSSALIDGDLDSIGSSINLAFDDPETDMAKAHYDSIGNHTPKAVCKITSVGTTYTFKLKVSDDDISYATVDTRLSSDPLVKVFLSGANQDFKYIKVTCQKTGGNNSTINILTYELYDGLTLGGTASLSFQIKDNISGVFFTAIPSSEFGTLITEGSIVEEIGDTLTKKHTLPSTQTDFRARLIVTGGGITMGVSILKVS